MTLRIDEGPEPLSEQSHRTGSAALLVESEATRVLRQEMDRYCRGHITGRSFLIAGHRGAGKTTLVAKAFQDTWTAAERARNMLRPLFIPLHGPSLFPPLAKRDSAPSWPAREPDKPPEAAQKAEKSSAQIALEQITLGLHRAVAKEFARRYFDRVGDLVYLRRTEREARDMIRDIRGSRTAVPAPDPYPDDAALNRLLAVLPEERELFALAAEFETELYQWPHTERLAAFYRRAGADSGGVLFRDGCNPLLTEGDAGYPTPPLPPGMRLDRPDVHAQGMRELVALSGVVEAYRRISGEYRRSEQQKEQYDQEQKRSAGFEVTKELAAPIAALLTGALAGTGLALSGASPVSTAVSGIAAALASGLVFKTSRTSRRETATTREIQFIFDLSVATLDRVLPILIERLREAGLAPVFVVDELDKVNRLAERIVDMVHHLKKLVAENAFFCFLTNRSYFEEMLAKGAGRPYPVEYTYYSQRLFVVYAPEDFDRYLRRRIPDPPRPAGPQAVAEDAQTAEERNARAFVRWSLRHRAQLHAGDLHREIRALRDNDGKVGVSADVLLSSLRNRIDLTAQLAIELCMAQRDVATVVMDRPEFRRLLSDAMYYLTREWLRGEESVNLSPVGSGAFSAYLEQRTGRDEERVENGPATVSGLSHKDCDFLYKQVQFLADFLSDRPSPDPEEPVAPGGAPKDWRRELLAAFGTEREALELDVEANVVGALLLGDHSLLLRDGPINGYYRFRYPVAGSVQAQVTPMAAAVHVEVHPDTWQEDAAFIEGYAEALARAQAEGNASAEVDLAALQSRFGIVSPTPTWSVVAHAMAQLRQAAARNTRHGTWDEDVFQVVQFREILQRNADRIVRALVCAAVVGLPRGEGPSSALRPTRILRGLEVIAQAHRFAGRSEEEVGIALDGIIGQIRVAFDLPLGTEPIAPEGDFGAHAAEIQTTIADAEAAAGLVLRKLRPEDIAHRAWVDIHDRLSRWVEAADPGYPTLSEIIAAAAGVGPTRVMDYDPRELSANDWTGLFLLARRPSAVPVAAVPAWLALFALHAMGFRLGTGTAMERMLDQIGMLNSPDPTADPEGLMDRTRKRAIESGGLLAGPPTESMLFAIVRDPAGALARLKGESNIAVLAPTVEQLSDLIAGSAFPALLVPTTRIRTVAIEMEPGIDDRLQKAFGMLNVLLQQPSVVYVYAQDQGRDMRQPAVVNPQSLSEIVQAAARAEAPLPLPPV